MTGAGRAVLVALKYIVLQEIAREKAGIFKVGAPALTVPQPPDAMAALQVLVCNVAPLLRSQAPGSALTSGSAPPLLKGKHCQSSSLLPPCLSCIFCCCASPPSALPSCVLHDGPQDTKAIPHETTAVPHHSWPPCPHMCRTILHRRRRQRWALAWRLRGRWMSSTVCRAGRGCRCDSAARTSCRTHRWR